MIVKKKNSDSALRTNQFLWNRWQHVIWVKNLWALSTCCVETHRADALFVLLTTRASRSRRLEYSRSTINRNVTTLEQPLTGCTRIQIVRTLSSWFPGFPVVKSHPRKEKWCQVQDFLWYTGRKLNLESHIVGFQLIPARNYQVAFFPGKRTLGSE